MDFIQDLTKKIMQTNLQKTALKTEVDFLKISAGEIKPAQKITVQEKFLHEKFVTFGKNAKEWTRKCILLLLEIEKHEIWKKKNFSCINEYAAKLAGMSHDLVNDSLRVLHFIEDKPALMKVVEMKGINAVRAVITIATKETAEFWAEKAMTMSKHTLEVYVREFRARMQVEADKNLQGKSDISEAEIGAKNDAENWEKFRPGTAEMVKNQQLQAKLNFGEIKIMAEIDFGQLPKTDNADSSNSERNMESSILENLRNNLKLENPRDEDQTTPKKLVAMQLDPQILAQLEKLKGENGDWNDLMKQLLQMREDHLEEQKPESVKTDSRHIPAKIDRYVTSRTNGQCAFPGCNKKLNIKHHTQRFALEKIHDSDRLYGLCKAHERIAHLGLIENEDLSPKLWKVRAGADTTSEIGKAKYAIDQVVQKFRASPA
jgi:hypothetical protein